MEQYIPKSALVAEIDRRIATYKDVSGADRITDALISFKNFLNIFKGVKEVDLEKAIDDYIYTNNGRKRMALELDWKQYDITFKAGKLINFAKHIFELGLKSKSSYVSTPNIDDTLKEMGVDPDSKSAKSFKEFYYMALEKFKAQKGEKV